MDFPPEYFSLKKLTPENFLLQLLPERHYPRQACLLIQTSRFISLLSFVLMSRVRPSYWLLINLRSHVNDPHSIIMSYRSRLSHIRYAMLRHSHSFSASSALAVFFLSRLRFWIWSSRSLVFWGFEVVGNVIRVFCSSLCLNCPSLRSVYSDHHSLLSSLLLLLTLWSFFVKF